MQVWIWRLRDQEVGFWNKCAAHVAPSEIRKRNAGKEQQSILLVHAPTQPLSLSRVCFGCLHCSITKPAGLFGEKMGSIRWPPSRLGPSLWRSRSRRSGEKLGRPVKGFQRDEVGADSTTGNCLKKLHYWYDWKDVEVMRQKITLSIIIGLISYWTSFQKTTQTSRLRLVADWKLVTNKFFCPRPRPNSVFDCHPIYDLIYDLILIGATNYMGIKKEYKWLVLHHLILLIIRDSRVLTHVKGRLRW